MEIERRNYDFEFRAEDGESPKIVGYGAVFGKRSENLGGFVEVIERGAFDGVLENDVRALWNHNADFILGRTASGTMRLSVDETGLRYEIDADADSNLVRDLVLRPMQRGDITQSSFGFTIGDDDWSEENGVPLRTIRSVSRLFDVSPVAYPAYPDASVALRRLDQKKSKAGKRAKNMKIEKRGRRLGSALDTAIEGAVTDDRPRSDVIQAMADAAGIEPGTVNGIIGGQPDCPPIERLEGFASALDVSLESLVNAAEADGCNYGGSEENSLRHGACKCGCQSKLDELRSRLDRHELTIRALRAGGGLSRV